MGREELVFGRGVESWRLNIFATESVLHRCDDATVAIHHTFAHPLLSADLCAILHHVHGEVDFGYGPLVAHGAFKMVRRRAAALTPCWTIHCRYLDGE